MSLKSLRKEKQKLIDQITEYQRELDGSALGETDREIIAAHNKSEKLSQHISDLWRIPENERTPDENFDLKQTNQEYEYYLFVLIPELNEKRTHYSSQEYMDNQDIQMEINILENEIREIDIKIDKKLDKNKEDSDEDGDEDGDSEDEDETDPPIDNRVWIDENLGISIDIDKEEVIGGVMKEILSGAFTSMKSNMGAAGAVSDIAQEKAEKLLDKQLSKIIKVHANPEKGGMAAILDVFIGILVKAIGSFAKHFFFLKDAIDLLVGFQLGPLLGKAIPGVVKVIQELQLLFTDPPKFIMKQLLGPLFDSNVPIPKFCINLGDFIPIFPFELCIPEIDPYGFFKKDSPMNLDTDQSKLSPTWLEEMMAEIAELKRQEISNTKEERKKDLRIINDEIEQIDDRINGVNKYTPMVKQSEIKLKKLKSQETECNINGCEKDYLDSICDEIINETRKLDYLRKAEINEDLVIKNRNLDLLKAEKENAEKKKENLNNKPIISKIEYKKKAILIAYDQNIDKDELDVKLSRIHEIGVDIYDNDNLEIIQKLGHDFSSDKYIERLEEIKSYGISLSNVKQLRFLYELGFNFNDKNHKKKVDDLRKNVSLDSTNLVMLIEMGLNIHNPQVYIILKQLKDMKLDILNADILVRLQTIGFNFNNPNIMDRLLALNKFIKLTDVVSFDAALKRNINLNNPYFTEVLEKTFKIGLRWGNTGNDNYFDIEEEIKADTQIPRNVDMIKHILNLFLNENEYYYQQFFDNEININNFNDIVAEKNTSLNYYFKNNNYNPYYIDRNLYNEQKIFLQDDYSNKTHTYTIISNDIDWESDFLSIRTNKNDGIYKEYELDYYDEEGKTDIIITGFTSIHTPATIIPPEPATWVTEKTFEVPYGQSLILVWNKPSDNTNNISFNVVDDSGTVFSGSSLASHPSGVTVLYQTPLKDVVEEVEEYHLESATLSHFKNIINLYDKYGININNVTIATPESSTPTVIEQQVPNIETIFPFDGEYDYDKKNSSRVLKNIKYFIEQLDLLKEFHENQGWVVDQNGEEVHVNENLGGDDYADGTLVDYSNIDAADYTKLAGAQQVVVENAQKGQISYDVLKAVVGNFDQLGLNIRDKNFQSKFNSLFEKFKITIDGSVILDTTREVLLTYTDVDKWEGGVNNLHHPVITLDLNKQKADPKVYAKAKYNAIIKITEVRKENVKVQPTKTVAQFEILQKLGFNYQIENIPNNNNNQNFVKTYNDFLNLFSGLKLDLKKYESKIIAETLVSLGWHWSIDRDFINLNKFKNLGFTFEVHKKKQQMYSKLDKLNTFGFNFSRNDATQIIDKLKSLDILLSNENFVQVIEKLIGLGINLNDNDWKQKLQVFNDYNISFQNDSDWNKQLNNIALLGIDFIGPDWEEKYRKMKNLKTFGLDFTLPELNKKLSILTNMGVDFKKPDENWKQKINSLVQLKLIHIPPNIEQKKKEYLKNRKDKLDNINDDLIKYHILNENPSALIDDKLQKKKMEIYSALNGTDDDKICDLQDEIKSLLVSKESINKVRPNYDKEINELNKEKEKSINEVYKLNEQLVFTDLDKFKELNKTNLNFYEDDYQKSVDFLLDNGFDFDLSDWLNKLKSLMDMIPGNPIMKWIMVLIELIKGVIMAPIMMLMGIIQKLMDMILAVVGIPLNPLDIPNWAKGILDKFMALIELIMGLPTLFGMMEFLIMSPDGLTLVDLFVPGFAAFVTMMFEKIAEFTKKSKELKQLAMDKAKEVEKLKVAQNLLKSKLALLNNLNPLDALSGLNPLDALDALIPGSSSDESNPETTTTIDDTTIDLIVDNNVNQLEIQKLKLLDKNEQLKIMVDGNTLNSTQLKNLQDEMEENCDYVDDIDRAISETESLKKLSPQLIENNIKNLNDLLNKNNEESEKLENESNALKSDAADIEKNTKNMANICDWGKNVDTLILNILKGLVDDLKGKPNTAQESYNKNQLKINKINKSLELANKKKEALEKYLKDVNSQTPNQLKNNLRIEELNKQLSQLEDKICNRNLTREEMNRLIDKINDIKNELVRLKLNQSLKEDDNVISNKLLLLNQLIAKLEENLNKLNIEQTSLAAESKSFLDKLNLDLLKLDGVAKWIPTILNIVCALPKMIVNIFIGIINGVGAMNFLPTLWEFPYI